MTACDGLRGRFSGWTGLPRADIRSGNSKIVEYEGRSYVVFKGLITAATALAMVATPAVATAQQTSVAARASAAEATPAGETVEGDNEMFQRRRRGFIIPLIAITLIILGLLIVFDDNDGAPVSP